jgi:hypothetical protein
MKEAWDKALSQMHSGEAERVLEARRQGKEKAK